MLLLKRYESECSSQLQRQETGKMKENISIEIMYHYILMSVALLQFY